jgi:hypothetical protein
MRFTRKIGVLACFHTLTGSERAEFMYGNRVHDLESKYSKKKWRSEAFRGWERGLLFEEPHGIMIHRLQNRPIRLDVN